MRRLLIVLGVALAAALAPLPAEASCKIATVTDGFRVIVGSAGDDGMMLRVYWGDGGVSTTREGIGAGRGRLLVLHDYAAPGSYHLRVELEAADAACRMETDKLLPDFPEEVEENFDVVPPRGAPLLVNETDDQDVDTVAEHPGRRIAGRARTGVVEALADALRGLLGRLFGR